MKAELYVSSNSRNSRKRVIDINADSRNASGQTWHRIRVAGMKSVPVSIARANFTAVQRLSEGTPIALTWRGKCSHVLLSARDVTLLADFLESREPEATDYPMLALRQTLLSFRAEQQKPVPGLEFLDDDPMEANAEGEDAGDGEAH